MLTERLGDPIQGYFTTTLNLNINEWEEIEPTKELSYTGFLDLHFLDPLPLSFL